MSNLKRSLLTLIVVFVVSTSGCAALLGDEPLEFTASEAVVDGETLAETGYELEDRDVLELHEPVEIAGQSREIHITNHIVTYSKSVDLGPVGEQPTGMVVVFTTPRVAVAGQSLNPIGQLSNADLVERFMADGGDVDDVREVDERTITIVGEETVATTYAATMEQDGQEIDVYVHVATAEHDDDIVVAVGTHPQELDDEAADVFATFEAIELDA